MEPRKLLHPQSSWSVAKVMNYLDGALSGTGPALSFGNIKNVSVPEKIALVIATSGSTGKAKAVALSSNAVITSAKLSNEYVEAKPGEVWSLLVSPNHSAGINILVRSLQLGTLPITDPNQKADFTAIVPTQLYRSLNGDEVLLKHLLNAKAVLVGGSQIAEDLLIQGRKKGINLITTYGMTETSGGCIYNGRALPGVEIRIGKTIEIKTPTLATTYLGNEELWRQKQAGDFFVTEDLGRIDGDSLTVIGRIDNVIISGGKNISLNEIENFLPFEVAAFAIPDPEWGETLNLAIVGDFDESKIQDSLKNNFGIRAKRIIKVIELPKSALGKIDRGALVSRVIK